MRDDADERQSQDYWTDDDQLRVGELGQGPCEKWLRPKMKKRQDSSPFVSDR
jgi:hypothetical protein